MSPPKLAQEQIVRISDLSPKGRGVVQDSNIEVIGALPNEEVIIELGAKRKRVRQGILRQIVTRSEDRVQPLCPHVPLCGGCVIQQMDYQAQLLVKEKIVRDLFAPLSSNVEPILGCDDPWRYRNKMEFSFSQNKEGEKFLGLMLAGARGRVLNLVECHLASTWFMDTLDTVRQWWESSSLLAYHHYRDTGHLRTLTLREAKKGKGKLVMLTVSGNPSFAIGKKWLNQFVEKVKAVAPNDELSIFLQIHQIAKGRPSQFFEILLLGPDHITEVLEIDLGVKRSMQFKISPTSFFQPNTLQAEKLYSTALKALNYLKGACVFDLYCGSAPIGLSAAKEAKEVIGIELNPHCVFDAGWNQEVNNIKNFSIIKGDVGEVLASLQKKADVVVVDPPRAGLDEAALHHILEAAPCEILYISCNPKTQFADVEKLCQKGYTIKYIRPVDQFPHTAHIENIVVLEKA